MEVKIQAIHFDASDKLVSFINKKADKLSRRFTAIVEIDFVLKVIKPEAALNKDVVVRAIAPQEEFVATKIADTFEEAIDVALEALERQLEKKKDRH